MSVDLSAPELLHRFTLLVLTLAEPGFDGIVTEHGFELRAVDRGAEVWRRSVLRTAGDQCSTDALYVGWLSTRRVISLLVEIERSGVYEALPSCGLVAGATVSGHAPVVTMRLVSPVLDRVVLENVPADGTQVRSVVRAIRGAVELAQEHALTAAG